MSRKDNAGVQVRKNQKEEFVRMARDRGTTQTQLFGDMLKLANAKVRTAKAGPERVAPHAGDSVIEAEIITDDSVIEAEIIAETIN